MVIRPAVEAGGACCGLGSVLDAARLSLYIAWKHFGSMFAETNDRSCPNFLFAGYIQLRHVANF